VIAQRDRLQAHSLSDDSTTSEGYISAMAVELASLRKELAALRRELQDINAIQSPLVGIEQMAQYFGKSQDTIRRWVKDRVISCHKIPNNKGHVLLFSFKQIENDLADYLQERL